jgi:hypothetical protein
MSQFLLQISYAEAMHLQFALLKSIRFQQEHKADIELIRKQDPYCKMDTALATENIAQLQTLLEKVRMLTK